MKSILCGLMLLASFSALAGPLDSLLGVYKAKDRDGTAVITRILIKEATLFEPAVYNYQVEVLRNKHDIDRIVDLRPSTDGKSLSAGESDDCDNPDCHAFTSFDVEVRKLGQEARVTIVYEGYDTEDGSDKVKEFAGAATFLKK